MAEPNVISYFLIIMSGFGTVWGFRVFSGRNSRPISEFAYAGFSTFWGSLNFLFYIWLLRDKIDSMMPIISQYPFLATPHLFVYGIIIGGAGAELHKIYVKLKGKVSKQ